MMAKLSSGMFDSVDKCWMGMIFFDVVCCDFYCWMWRGGIVCWLGNALQSLAVAVLSRQSKSTMEVAH